VSAGPADPGAYDPREMLDLLLDLLGTYLPGRPAAGGCDGKRRRRPARPRRTRTVNHDEAEEASRRPRTHDGAPQRLPERRVRSLRLGTRASGHGQGAGPVLDWGCE